MTDKLSPGMQSAQGHMLTALSNQPCRQVRTTGRVTGGGSPHDYRTGKQLRCRRDRRQKNAELSNGHAARGEGDAAVERAIEGQREEVIKQPWRLHLNRRVSRSPELARHQGGELAFLFLPQLGRSKI